jgi:LPXTG-motif cell wall-anchored protein
MTRRITMGVATTLLALGITAAPAAAQEYPGPQPPETIPRVDQPPAPPAPTEVLGVRDERAAMLPVTGGDVVGLAAAGAGAVVLGGGLLLARRRQTTG